MSDAEAGTAGGTSGDGSAVDGTASDEPTGDGSADDGSAGEAFDPERLAELVDLVGEHVGELKRAIVDDEDGGDVVELAEDLWAVLEELEELLETLDFEELPEAIDLEDLPEAVDVEDLPGALFDEDETAIELSGVREAVNLREVWDAVDLTEFLQEKRELDSAIDDVAGHVGSEDDGDDGDDGGGFEKVVDADLDGGLSGAARQAFVEQKVKAAVEKFRSAILSTHDGLRKVYEKNQEKLGQSGNQPDSLNPTAVSTKPPGPLPDSISTRASTVPPEVRYSRVDNPRRIFGRRFEERRDAEDGDPDDGAADTGAADATDDDDADTDDRTDDDTDDRTDGVPRIEVFEDDV